MTEPYPYRPAPYPNTVEEILAAAWMQPQTPGPYAGAPLQMPAPAGPVSVLVVHPGGGGAFPVPMAPAPYPAPMYYPQGQPAPQQHYYLPAPVEPAPQQQPRQAAWSDAPLWVRLSAAFAALGIGAAGIGYGIGQAAPGIDAFARLLWGGAAIGTVGLGWFLFFPRQRQQQAPSLVANITANVSATAVGKQRNRY